QWPFQRSEFEMSRRSEELTLIIKHIGNMTDQNDHSGAILSGAEWLAGQRSKLYIQAKALDTLIRTEGGPEHGLREFETHLYKKLMHTAKDVLSEKDYKNFRTAF